MANLEESKSSSNAYKNLFKSLKNSMDEAELMYKCLDQDDLPTNRMEKQQILIDMMIPNQSDFDTLTSLADEIGMKNCIESANNISAQYDRLLQRIKTDFSSTKDQQNQLDQYVNSLHDMEDQIKTNRASLHDLCSRNLIDGESVAKAKILASEIRKQMSEIQDKQFQLEQQCGQKLKPYIKALDLNQSSRDMPSKISDLLHDLNKYVDKCDEESHQLTQYNGKISDLEDLLSDLRSGITNIEKSEDFTKTIFQKLQDIKLKTVDAEHKLEEAKTMSNSCDPLARSSKAKIDVKNAQQKLLEINERIALLQDKSNQKVITSEKCQNLEQSFRDLLKNAQEEVIKLESKFPNENSLDNLCKYNNNLHNIQSDLLNILHNEIDKQSDHYRQLSENHQSRATQLQLIDNKLNEFRTKFKYANEHLSRCNAKKTVIEDGIKRLELRLNSLPKPSDLALLQSNEMILRSLRFDSEELDLKSKDLEKDIQNKLRKHSNDSSINSINQLCTKIDTIKQRIEGNLEDYKNAKEEIRKHQHSIQVARNFLNQSQRKLSKSQIAVDNIYQIENELEKNNELAISLEKNKKLISDCTEVNMANLRCLSNEGMAAIQREIDDIVDDYNGLKNSTDESKNVLVSTLKELKGKDSIEEGLKLWLKREEKKFKLSDQVDGEEAIIDEMKRLQSLASELAMRLSDVRIFPVSQNKLSDWKSLNLKERCENLLESVQKKSKHLEQMSREFDLFNKHISEWKHWYDAIIDKRNQIKSVPDANMRDLLKSFLKISNEKFENVLSITSIGESLLPFLTISGREKMKFRMKFIKEQWHEIFDELPIFLDILEGKIKKNESITEALEQLQIEFSNLSSSLLEEIDEKEPLKITYQLGLENKERQLQRFSQLKQHFNALDYSIKRLENAFESNEKDDLIINVTTLTDQFKLSTDLLDNAKKMCQESCQNHQTFDIAYMKVQDHLNSLKKKVSLCEVMDGSTNSLESRMSRIQELMNSEHETDKVLNQLTAAYNSFLTTSNDAEQKSFKDRFEAICNDRKITSDLLKSTRLVLESSYKDLAKFKSKFDALSLDISNLQQEIPLQSNNESHILNQLIDKAKSLSMETKALEDLGSEILQDSKNPFPLNLVKSLQNQLHDSLTTLERNRFELDQTLILQSQLDFESKTFETILQAKEASLNSLMKNFEECQNMATCASIHDNVEKISLQHQQSQFTLESMQNIIQNFANLSPAKYVENKSDCNRLKQNHEKFSRNFNQFKSRFDNVNDNCQEINNRLADAQVEMEYLTLTEINEMPNEKLSKFNIINELNIDKHNLLSIKDRLMTINIKSISHRLLNEYFEKEKNSLVKSVEWSINEVDKKLTDINKSLLDQEQMDSKIKSVKEAIYSIDLNKQTMFTELSMNRFDSEDKLKDLNKIVLTLESLKRDIDEITLINMTGCSLERKELNSLQNQIEKSYSEIKSTAIRLNKEIENSKILNNRIKQIEKRKVSLDEEIKNLIENGTSFEDKKRIVDKLNNVKKEILSVELEIDGLNDSHLNGISNALISQDLCKSISNLENHNKDQREKVDKLLEQYQRWVSSEESFDNVYREILQEIANKKIEIQNTNKPISLNELKQMVTKLNDQANDCGSIGSSDGKNLVTNKLKYVEKTWKDIQSVQEQMKWKREKEEMKMLEFHKQSKHLMEWFGKIENSLRLLEDLKPDDISEKKMKYFEAKSLRQQAKEWKTEMDKHLNERPNVESERKEISVNDKDLTNEINIVVSESKLALTYQLEFDNKVTEFSQWMTMIDSQFGCLNLKYDFSSDPLSTEIKDYTALQLGIMDGEPSLKYLNECLERMICHTSSKGQRNLEKSIKHLTDKYYQIREIVNDKLRELNLENERVKQLQIALLEYKTWLADYDEIFANFCLFSTIQEKEACLEKYKGLLQSLEERKNKLNYLLEQGKNLSLHFPLNKDIRELQIRFSTLITTAQRQMNALEQCVSTHRSFERDENEFRSRSNLLFSDFSNLKDKMTKVPNSNEIIDLLDLIDKSILDNKGLKASLTLTFQTVMEQTNDDGKRKLSKLHTETMTTYDSAVESYFQVKSQFLSNKIRETQMTNLMEHYAIWLSTFEKMIQNHPLTSQIYVPILQTYITGTGQFSKELNRKLNNLQVTMNDYGTDKNENTKTALISLQRKFELTFTELTERRINAETLLKLNFNYLNSVDNINQWLMMMNKAIKSILDLRGPESMVLQRSENLKTALLSISNEGRSMMNLVTEAAGLLVRNMSSENDMEKITEQVNGIDREYSSLTNKSQNAEAAINEILYQWNSYNKTVQCLSQTVDEFATRKQLLKKFECIYSSNVDDQIAKLTILFNAIQQTKENLDQYAGQIESLKNISQDPLMEITLQDIMEQLDGHELDCRSQIDRLALIKNERISFDLQYQMTNNMINSMTIAIMDLDKLQDFTSISDYQTYCNEIQLLESKLANGDRMVDDCLQMSHELAILYDSDKSLNKITVTMKIDWNKTKAKFIELKSRMNRLSDVWTSCDFLSNQIESWIRSTQQEIENISSAGYQDDDLNERCLQKLNNSLSESGLVKEKLSKFIELFYKAEAHPGFSKSKDPLILEKLFCESVEKIGKAKDDLVCTQSTIEKLMCDLQEAQMWIFEMSLFIDDEFQKVPNINNIIDLKNRLKLCKDIKNQIENYNENRIKMIIQSSKELDRVPLNASCLKPEITIKIQNLNQSIAQIISKNEDFKNIIKKRSSAIRRLQNVIENIESFLYQELSQWWTENEITISTSTDDSDEKIKKVSCLFEKAKFLNNEFEKVCQHHTPRRNSSYTLSRTSDSFDTISGETLLTQSDNLYDDHSFRIRVDLKKSIDKLQQKLCNLQNHKKKWNLIDNEINEFSKIFSRQRAKLQQIVSSEERDDRIYDQFEKLLEEVISKRNDLELLNEQIQTLNGNDDKYGVVKYDKYSKLCKNYGDLLHKMEIIRLSLTALDVQDSCEIFESNDFNDFTQNVNRLDFLALYPQSGTQTNRSKSIQTLRRFSSNPDLSKTTQTIKRKEFQQKMIQTVNDIGVQATKKSKRKDKKFKRLQELLAMVRKIRDEISSSNAEIPFQRTRTICLKSDNPLRESVESVRHNLTPSKSMRIKSPRKSSLRESFELLGTRTSPAGCLSPKSFSIESPRKSSRSPKRSARRIESPRKSSRSPKRSARRHSTQNVHAF